MPPETTSPGSPLDADTIAAQAAAFAQHLQRSGVLWMPKPRSEVVESLRSQFVQPENAVNETADSADKLGPHRAPDANDRPDSSAPSRPAHAPDVPVSGATPTARTETSRQSPTQSSALSPAATAPVAVPAQHYPGNRVPDGERASQLAVINSEVQGCTRCEILSSCRKHTVFGEGSPTPRFVFFGEGPGAEEDQQGRPFVGRAGQLLTKMIEACKLSRDEVYIMNSVKCRPPANRNPEPNELENCREYYQRQLLILQPEYIVCLGAVSSQELMQNKTSVGKMRGRLHRYYDSKVLVTYHPAYLLRTPAAKRAAWEDLQLMMRDAGIPVG